VARYRAPRPLAADSAESGALRNDQRRRMVALLAALPVRQRECVVLRHYAGLSEAETADLIGISVGSVKTHTHRALARLAEQLEQGE